MCVLVSVFDIFFFTFGLKGWIGLGGRRGLERGGYVGGWGIGWGDWGVVWEMVTFRGGHMANMGYSNFWVFEREIQ